MEAAARPFPRDDTTPPVTKMYLVWDMVSTSNGTASIMARRRQQPAHLLEVLRRVDADRVVRRLDRLDPDPVFQGAELFERLGAFERRRLERREHEQSVPAIRVHADMLVQRRPA